MTPETNELLQRLERIEAALLRLEGKQEKDWYSTDELAAFLEKAPYTCREWARHGRINAKKRACGRGRAKEWVVSADEVKRIQEEGLLPFPEHQF